MRKEVKEDLQVLFILLLGLISLCIFAAGCASDDFILNHRMNGCIAEQDGANFTYEPVMVVGDDGEGSWYCVFPWSDDPKESRRVVKGKVRFVGCPDFQNIHRPDWAWGLSEGERNPEGVIQ